MPSVDEGVKVGVADCVEIVAFVASGDFVSLAIEVYRGG